MAVTRPAAGTQGRCVAGAAVIEGPTARARIATLIWPVSDVKHAGNSLRQRLVRRKRIAGQDVVLGDRLLALASHVQHDLGALADRTLLNGDRGLCELPSSSDYSDSPELGAWVQIVREQWRAARHQMVCWGASRCRPTRRCGASWSVW